MLSLIATGKRYLGGGARKASSRRCPPLPSGFVVVGPTAYSNTGHN